MAHQRGQRNDLVTCRQLRRDTQVDYLDPVPSRQMLLAYAL
jgi:hypothetical protein